MESGESAKAFQIKLSWGIKSEERLKREETGYSDSAEPPRRTKKKQGSTNKKRLEITGGCFVEKVPPCRQQPDLQKGSKIAVRGGGGPFPPANGPNRSPLKVLLQPKHNKGKKEERFSSEGGSAPPKGTKNTT